MHRTCSTCGRPFRPGYRQYQCSRCAPTPTHTARPGKARHGSTRQLRKHRAAILATNPPCFYCPAPATQVDHRYPVSLGGTDTLDNLVPACSRCNQAKGDTPLHVLPTLAFVAPPGSGKTALASAIHQETGWQYLAIDEYRTSHRSWDTLVRDLNALTASGEPAVTESVAIPRTYRTALLARRATIVTLDIPDTTRQQRLTERDAGHARERRWDDTGNAHRILNGTEDHTTIVHDLIATATRRAMEGGGPTSGSNGGRTPPGLLCGKK